MAAASDLYGDIYADEFQEFLDDVEQNGAPAETPAAATSATASTAGDNDNDDGMAPPQLNQPQPIPTEDGSSSSSSRLSYSAQIAQQFSSYKQTPSQERQQRAQSGTGAAAGTPTPDGVFGKKPSEMHDAG